MNTNKGVKTYTDTHTVSLATPYPQWKNLLASRSRVSMTPSAVQFTLMRCDIVGITELYCLPHHHPPPTLYHALTLSEPPHRLHTNTVWWFG